MLIARVHNLVDKPVWKKRYAQINDFERMLSENRVHVLKFFLHISKDEQKKRFLKRLKDPARNWKFSPADVEERKYWGSSPLARQAFVTNRCCWNSASCLIYLWRCSSWGSRCFTSRAISTTSTWTA